MSLTTLFSTPIWQHDFTEAELSKIQDQIKNKITAMIAQSQPAPWGDSVSTTWNPSRNNDIEQFGLEGLAMGIIDQFLKFLNAMDYRGDGLRLKSSWINWHKRGGFSFEHSHPSARVCGMYIYQSNGEDAKIRFSNPHPSQTLGHWPCDYENQPWHYVDAQAGRLIFWPAYLDVRIEPNCTDNEFVYISFTLV
jgi:uncharacterized protein (TIGR02466 family)